MKAKKEALPTPAEAFDDIKGKIDGCGDKNCLVCPRNKLRIKIVEHALHDAEVIHAKAVCYEAVVRLHRSRLECTCIRSSVTHYDYCSVRDNENTLAEAEKHLAEIEAKHQPLYACRTCKDTHQMELDEGVVMCTHCPVPCQECRSKPQGPYCATNPCYCECHVRNK